ncbi:MAG: IS630 family transposase [Bacteroidetes bacterium]|nr:IS630 family transposase [Bacteroidota bacterium]
MNCQAPWPRLLFRLQLKVLIQHKIPDATISVTLGCSIKTVQLWNKRFQNGDSIFDKPRSGRPTTFSTDVTFRLISLYCQHDPLPGVSRWTIRTLQIYIQKNPNFLNCQISCTSIHRLLKSHSLKPYQNKYFLQISDPYFFEKMEKILQVYASNYPYLFCFDECTGLQALERVAPRLPSKGNRPEYLEPEYIRHGTVSLFSILQVSTGDVFSECIPDHKSVTIIQALEKHILQFDKFKVLHYICDNYSSHSTNEFCSKIAELCEVELPILKTLEERKQWLESPAKRIVFHFLPTHGSWLNLIEIWFGILQQKALKDESFSSKAELEKRIMDFTETWDTHFKHPFEFTYTGDGLHEKVISRFITWIEMESSQLSEKFLCKQIKLIINLAKKYWSKGTKSIWKSLKAILEDKVTFIKSIIKTDKTILNLIAELNTILHSNLTVT